MQRSCAKTSIQKAFNKYRPQRYRANKESVKVANMVNYERTKADWPEINAIGIDKPDWRLALPGNVGVLPDQQREMSKAINFDALLDHIREANIDNNLKKIDIMKDTKDISDKAVTFLSDAAQVTENLNHKVNPPLSDSTFHHETHQEISLAGNPSLINECANFISKSTNDITASKVPKLLLKELEALSPKVGTMKYVNSIITVAMKTNVEMTSFSDETVGEREATIKQFMKFAKDLCYCLQENGSYADFINPETGRPYFGKVWRNVKPIFETHQAFDELEKLKIEDIGCCKVMTHADFGKNVVVGTIFTESKMDSWVIEYLLKKDAKQM